VVRIGICELMLSALESRQLAVRARGSLEAIL
jgi:hypothetical protein